MKPERRTPPNGVDDLYWGRALGSGTAAAGEYAVMRQGVGTHEREQFVADILRAAWPHLRDAARELSVPNAEPPGTSHAVDRDGDTWERLGTGEYKCLTNPELRRRPWRELWANYGPLTPLRRNELENAP